MNSLRIVEKPNLTGKRRVLVLSEDRVGHYPEFREFFARQFALKEDRLGHPGHLIAPSGMIFTLVFLGRSGELFPDGVEVYAQPDALEPLNDDELDTDLWAILRWMIEGVGGDWKVEDLESTGRLYQLPFLLKK